MLKKKLAACVAATASAMTLATSAGSIAWAKPDTALDVTLPSGITMSETLEDYLYSLPENDRQPYVDSNLPAEVEVSIGEQVPADAIARTSRAQAASEGQELSPMATGCWTQRWTWGPKALAGNTLYTYYQVGYWCSSGTRVTAASTADAGGETKTPGWRYEGITRNAAGVVANQGRSYTQHKFVLGAGGIDIQTPLECARVRGLSTGRSAADSTCGIY